MSNVKVIFYAARISRKMHPYPRKCMETMKIGKNALNSVPYIEFQRRGYRGNIKCKRAVRSIPRTYKVFPPSFPRSRLGPIQEIQTERLAKIWILIPRVNAESPNTLFSTPTNTTPRVAQIARNKIHRLSRARASPRTSRSFFSSSQ